MRRAALVVALLAPLAGVAPGGAQTTDTADIYAHAGANALAPAAARARSLVYVPNSHDGTVAVIDPATYRVVRTFPTGALPQHVVPSYDLTTLWVANNLGNSLTPIDPATGREGSNVAVDDPYNLYFTPDGRFAIVIAERRRRLDFRDAHTMALVQSLPVACKGVDHMEFTADGRYAVATCEFSGQLVKVDLATRTVLGYLTLDPGGLDSAAMPQDIRSRADGRVFYVADMRANGVYLVDPDAFRRIGFVATGKGTHGIYPSRDGRQLYVTNRGWNTTAGGRHGPGTITVLDPATERIVATWPVRHGGTVRLAQVDVRDRAAVHRAADELVAAGQVPDVLLNNAGLASGLSKIHEGDPDDWDRMIDTNLKGLLYVTRAVLPHMVARRRGHVVNIGSTAGHQTYPMGDAYNATKFGVRALTEGMNLDVAGTPIRISSVDPGFVETEFSDVRFHGDRERAAAVYQGFRPLTADDVADAIAYVVNLPEHVNILDLIIMPTAQRNVYVVDRES